VNSCNANGLSDADMRFSIQEKHTDKQCGCNGPALDPSCWQSLLRLLRWRAWPLTRSVDREARIDTARAVGRIRGRVSGLVLPSLLTWAVACPWGPLVRPSSPGGLRGASKQRPASAAGASSAPSPAWTSCAACSALGVVTGRKRTIAEATASTEGQQAQCECPGASPA
jgi:hypothetical protein